MEWSLWRSDALAMRGFGNVQCQSDASVAKWRVIINVISANYFAQNEKINAYENYSWTNNINYLNLFIIIYFFNQKFIIVLDCPDGILRELELKSPEDFIRKPGLTLDFESHGKIPDKTKYIFGIPVTRRENTESLENVVRTGV